jgi:CheY-like chemotaxis protein
MIMPEVGGIDVIRQVRKDHPNLWIVAISGGGDMLSTTVTLTLSEAFGADRILYKPFVKSELLAALERTENFA